MNKSLITNLAALTFIATGLAFESSWADLVLNVGLFAFSGALTNWLAIHMLFEKVPGFYGSGVIPARFKDFKSGIHQLIMRQFFTEENISRFFEGDESNGQPGIDLIPLVDSVNLDPTFEALKEAVINSQFGGALAMFGGPAALDPIKPTFVDKMRASVKDIVTSDDFQHRLLELANNGVDHSELLDRVNVIVERRLEELTPKMVKDIIQQMIRDHLGWLVVWGGVFGGLIGLVAGLIQA